MFISRNTFCILALALTASQTVALDFICPPNLEEGANLNRADPENCSWFYACPREGGKPNHWECEAGKKFDPNLNYCEESDQCIIKYEFECTDALRGESLFHAHEEDCNRYYTCYNKGSTVIGQCPLGQTFDPNLHFCVESNKCIFKCPRHLTEEDKLTYYDPKNCQKYYKCTVGKKEAVHLLCPETQVFNPSTGMCDTPENAPGVCRQPITAPKCENEPKSA